jgi:Na+/melibiose symporter-like transporter
MAGIFILTGYVPGAAVQSPSAQMGIRILVGGIPAVCCFLGALVIFVFYDLKDEKREQLMKSLREKGL